MEVEVEWESEYWQARIKKVKTRSASSGANNIRVDPKHINVQGLLVTEVLVEYVGGQEDENEWVALSSNRYPSRRRPTTPAGHVPQPDLGASLAIQSLSLAPLSMC